MARFLLGLAAWIALSWTGLGFGATSTPYPDLRFTRHDGPEGPFRQSFVRLYTDRDGYLWGSTLDSVFRFDGHRFQQWPITGGNSAAFSEDAAGHLWVLTEDELWLFDPQRVVQTRVQAPKVRHGWNTELAHGPEGTWLLTRDGGLYRYSPADGAFQMRWKSPPHDHMIEARATNQGVLWWLTDRALWRFSPAKDRAPRVVKRFDEVPRNKGNALVIESSEGEVFCLALEAGAQCISMDGKTLLDHYVNAGCSAMEVDRARRLHVLCGDTLFAQKNKRAMQLEPILKLPKRPFVPTYHLMQRDDNGRIWLGLGNGFGIFNPETGDYQDIPIGEEDRGDRLLPAPVFATNVMLVDQNNVWFGLNGKGLYRARLTPSPFEHWSPPGDSAAANAPLLRAVYEATDPQGRSLWLADARERIWRIPIDTAGRLGHGIPAVVAVPSAQSECRALARSPEGRMMYATQDRLFTYRNEINTFVPVEIEWHPSIPQTRLCGLHLDKDNRLWTFGDFGIAQLESNGPSSYRARIYGSGLNVRRDLYDRLHEGSDGWWWIPYRNGIQRFDPKQHRWQILSRDSAPLGATWIHQVLELPAGVYWLATRGGGLQRVDLREGQLTDKSRWQTIQPPSESHSPIRYSILPDADGLLWLAGGRGLDRYDPVNGRWLHFDSDDGLEQVEFNHGAATALLDGRLVFVGLNGLTIVHPERVHQNRSAPAIGWQGMQINGGPMQSVNEPLNLDFDKSSATIHYQALDYDAPRSIRYRYRMRSDEPWIDIGDQRQLHFAGLPIGEYALEIQAAYNHGGWSGSGKVLPIVVAPPWYLTWQAWLMGLVLAVFGAAGYVRSRNLQQRRLQAEIDSKTLALRESNASLAERNAALRKSHGELNEQKRRLELALGAREKLFRIVSHEFRTPLTKIVLPLDEMIRSSSEARVGDRLMTMRRGVDRLVEMIDVLLDKAKASSELDMSFEKVAVGKIIMATAQDFVPVFRSRQQLFAFACELDSGVEAMLTRDCLPIILDNLLGNASKYTLEGGRIHLFSYLLNELLVIQVTDTGIGMDEETREQLYSPFYRGKAARDSGVHGHGLGLHLVFDVVHRNGGDIDIASETGRGTTFTVCLPISDSIRTGKVKSSIDRPLPTALSNDVGAASGKVEVLDVSGLKTLLIVEDEDEIRKILVEHFSTDYRCLDAPNGGAALSIAADQLPDMILCDIDLPGMNGYDVCMELKKNEQTAHIPVIFLTAYASDSAKLQALRVHGDDFITKPPSMEELSLKIANRLRTRDALLQRAKGGHIPAEIELPEVATKDQEFVAKSIKFRSDLDKALDAHFARSEFDVSFLARTLHRSTRTLQRHMELYGIGATPLEYIREFRLKKAAELLRKNRRVALVAMECGLDPRTFSGIFRERYGRSPSEWRRSNFAHMPNESGIDGYASTASTD